MNEQKLITIDPNELQFIQSRETINDEIVMEYAQDMTDGQIFDPVDAIQDEAGKIYVWDGNHRGMAAKKAGCKIKVNVSPGSFEEASWMSLTANQRHGLRRTTADKRHIVKLALLHKNGYQKSNREIARHCGVSDKTVASIRKSLEVSAEIPHIETITVKRNGTTYTQKKEQNLTVDEIIILIKDYLTACADQTILKLILLSVKHRKTDCYINAIMSMEGKKLKTDVIHAYIRLLHQLNNGTYEKWKKSDNQIRLPHICFDFESIEFEMYSHWTCNYCQNVFNKHHKKQLLTIYPPDSKCFVMDVCMDCKNNVINYAYKNNLMLTYQDFCIYCDLIIKGENKGYIEHTKVFKIGSSNFNLSCCKACYYKNYQNVDQFYNKLLKNKFYQSFPPNYFKRTSPIQIKLLDDATPVIEAVPEPEPEPQPELQKNFTEENTDHYIVTDYPEEQYSHMVYIVCSNCHRELEPNHQKRDYLPKSNFKVTMTACSTCIGTDNPDLYFKEKYKRFELGEPQPPQPQKTELQTFRICPICSDVLKFYGKDFECVACQLTWPNETELDKEVFEIGTKIIELIKQLRSVMCSGKQLQQLETFFKQQKSIHDDDVEKRINVFKTYEVKK